MTKQELQKYCWIQRNIQQLEEKLFELETKATRMTAHLFTQAPGSSGYSHDKIANIVTKIMEVKEEINNQLQKMYDLLGKIEKAIETLPPREKYLIRARYIEGKTWERIAVDMNYSWQHVHKIHSRALKLLAEKDASKCDNNM